MFLLDAGVVWGCYFGEEGVVEGNILEEEGGEGSNHLHGDDARILIRSLEAFGKNCSNFIPTVNSHQYFRVMPKNNGDSLFDVKGFSSLYEIKHSHDKRVDQINLFHFTQEKVNLIEGISDLSKITTTKFAIKIKIFNLLFLIGPQHVNLYFYNAILNMFINHLNKSIINTQTCSTSYNTHPHTTTTNPSLGIDQKGPMAIASNPQLPSKISIPFSMTNLTSILSSSIRITWDVSLQKDTPSPLIQNGQRKLISLIFKYSL